MLRYCDPMMMQALFDLIDSLHKKKIGVIGHSLGTKPFKILTLPLDKSAGCMVIYKS